MRKLFAMLAFLTLAAGARPTSLCAAFHSGGVGSCSACHAMHNSEDGVAVRTGNAASLLRASDAGSICLNCHAGAGGPAAASVFSFDGSAFTPGGDFYWLTRTFSWAGGDSPGARHGHSVTAVDFGLTADPYRDRAPGGNYPAARLSCISCHDPHGSVRPDADGAGPVSVSGSYGESPAAGTRTGHYRLLGDASYVAGGYAFSADAPTARQSAERPFAESDAAHVDYGAGMSEWCGNCHARILSSRHNAGGSGFQHPAGATALLDPQTVSYYNAYVRSGDLTGSAATAYLQFVPFERGTDDPLLLDPNSSQGPDASANVMCLTCHRAHASAFPYAGRWDFSAGRLVDSHPAFGDAGAAAVDVVNSYYGRDIAAEFGAEQGSFCEKCHPDGTP